MGYLGLAILSYFAVFVFGVQIGAMMRSGV